MANSHPATIPPATACCGLFLLLGVFLPGSGTWAGMAATDATTAAPTTAATGQVDLPAELSSSDWQSIRMAYAANRHAVRADALEPGSYRARNPGQQWSSSFTANGVAITPDHGRWQFGLRLARWGHAGHEQPVAAIDRIAARGQRTVYRYSDGLQEWFVNDQRGLEHGFTVTEPPAGGGDQLRFELRVSGDLAPRVSANGRDVAFIDAHGKTALTYNKLRVWDADGQPLTAGFRSDGQQLALSIDASAARYPLTIDPLLQQQAYLKASNTDASDFFGFSVAVSGDTVVVGAPGEASNATGVDGNQGDNSAFIAGAAYVFVRDGSGNWSQQAYLKASNTDAFDQFGISVAVSGDTVVVGADREDSNATGVDGNQGDNSASNAGAAYVFVRDGSGNWAQQAYLKASNTNVGDFFGDSVAVSGDTVVVGADGEDSNATGVDGDPSDNSASSAGAAYVFVRDGSGNWAQQAYLKASNTDAFDQFGISVAVSGDTVVVGAIFEDSNATGVDGNQGDNSATIAGAAYVFVRDGSGNWAQQAYLKASNTDAFDQFGTSVAVSGDTVVVGADGEASNATGVDGDQNANLADNAGAAYVFVRDGSGNWAQQAYLKASNTDAGDNFGTSVAVSGDTVVVGALFEDGNATGVDGDQGDNSATSAGAAYVFVRDGSGTWSQQAYLKASNTDGGDNFGTSLAVSGDTVVVGANFEASNATGVDGDQGDNSADAAGAAYVFAAPQFTVGGTVSGLNGNGLVLQNNGGDDLAITTNGSFTFATALDDGSAYAVTVATQPTGLSQTCTVSNGSGTIAGGDVSNVQVDCVTDTFTIGGMVSGLNGSGLVLQNNGGDDLSISANGSFTFATALDDGTAYAVTVATQPTSPSQTCTVSNGSGTIAGGDVSNVQVDCVTDTFTIGGMVSGLNGSGLVLQNNGGDDLSIGADGSFTFPTALDDGSAYAVTVLDQPTGPIQTCSVSNGSGTLAGSDVTDVQVDCVTDTFTIGGMVSGLNGSGLVLQNNGGDDLAVAADGSFTFPTALDDGSAYAVTVLDQPTGPIQTCSVSNGSGTLAGADVSNVEVECVDEPPEVALSAAGIDFGMVVIGSTSVQTVTLTNTGTGELNISDITAPTPPFAMAGGSCLPPPSTLLPGESCTIDVEFAPDSISSQFTGSIDIISNAATSPDTISLSGSLVPLAVEVPTLSRAGVLLLALLLAVLGWVAVGKRQAG